MPERACTVFGAVFERTRKEARLCLRLWNRKRTFSRSLSTPALKCCWSCVAACPGKHPVTSFRVRGRVLPLVHELSQQRMQRHRRVRSLVLGICSDLLALPASRLGGGLKVEVSFGRKPLTHLSRMQNCTTMPFLRYVHCEAALVIILLGP